LQQQLAPSYVRVIFANLSALLQAAVDDAPSAGTRAGPAR
jgi:hypothetical protein